MAEELNPTTNLPEDGEPSNDVKWINERFKQSLAAPRTQTSGTVTNLDVTELLKPVDVSKAISAESDPHYAKLLHPEELRRDADFGKLMDLSTERFQKARVARMEQLDAEQTYEEAINGTGKLLGKTVNRAVLGLAGTVWGMIKGLVTWDANALQENAIFDFSEGIDTWLDESLPIYTNEDEYYDKGFFGKLAYHPGKFIGDEVADAVSFASSAVLQEAIMSGISAATFGGGTATQAAGTARLARQGSSIWQRLSGASKIIKSIRGLDKSAEGAQILSTLQKSASTAKKMDQWKAAAGTARSLLISSNYEAAVESRQTQEEMKTLLTEEYVKEHGAPPTGQALKAIEESANKAKWLSYGGNMAILSLGNLAQFPKIFLKGYKGQATAYKKLLEKGAKGKYTSKLANQKGLVTGTKILLKGSGRGVIEAAEETSQGILNHTSLDYYKRKHDYNSAKNGVSLFESFGRGTEEFFGDYNEASTSMGLGFLLGMLGVPTAGRLAGSKRAVAMTGGLFEARRDFKRHKDNVATMAEYLNKQPNAQQGVKAAFENLVNGITLQEDIDAAIESGDIFSFKNLEHDQFFSYVNSRVKADLYDTVEQDLNAMKAVSFEQFSKDFSLGEATEFTEENKNKIIDKAIEKARVIKEYAEVVSDLTDSTIADRKIAEAVKDPLIHAASTIHNLDRREGELTDRLTDLTGIEAGTIDEITKVAYYYNSVERLSKLAKSKQGKKELTKEQNAEFNKLVKKLKIDKGALESLIEAGPAIDHNELRKLVGDVQVREEITSKKFNENVYIDNTEFQKSAQEAVNNWSRTNPSDAAIYFNEVEGILNDLVKIKNRRETFSNFFKYLGTPEGAQEFAKLDGKIKEQLANQFIEGQEAVADHALENAETPEEIDRAREKAHEAGEVFGDEVNKKISGKAKRSRISTPPISPDTLRTDTRNVLEKRYEGKPELFSEEIKDLADIAMKAGMPYISDSLDLEGLITTLEKAYNMDLTDLIEGVEDYFATVSKEVDDTLENEHKDNEDPQTPNDEEGADTPLTNQEHTEGYWENPLRGATRQYHMDKHTLPSGKEVWIADTSRPEENFFDVNWDKVNSPSTLQEGSEINFKVDLQKVFGGKDKYHKSIENQKAFNSNFHVTLTSKDNGVEFNAAGLAANVSEDSLVNKDNKAKNKQVLDIRNFIIKELIDAGHITKKGDIYRVTSNAPETFTSSLSSKVKYKGTGRIALSTAIDSFEEAMPVSEVLSSDEELIFGVGRTYGDAVVIEVPNTTIKLPAYNGVVPGAVYAIVKGANNEFTANRLKTRKITPAELDEVSGLLSDIHINSKNKKDWIPFQEKINEIVYLDVHATGINNQQFKIKQRDNTWSDPMNTEQVLDLIRDRRAQVSLKKINRENYNEQVDGDKVRTTMNAGNHTHSAMFDIQPVNFGAPTTTDQDVKTVKIPNVNDRFGVERNEAELLEVEGDLPFDDPAVDTQKSKNPLDQLKPSKKGKRVKKAPKLGKGKKRFRMAKKGSYKMWNREEELRWAKRTIKKVPVHVAESIQNISDNGGDIAWGVFKNAAIHIADNAAEGTTQHEAFHAVFWLYLNDAQRHALLVEAQTKTGLQDDVDLEEWMADGFMEYVQTNVFDNSLKGKINRFFGRLKNLIDRILGKESYTIDRLFKAINDGNFKNRKLNKLDGVKSIKDVVRWRIPGMNPMQKAARIDMFNHFVIEELNDLQLDNEDLTINEILKNVSLPEMYKDAYITVYYEYYQPLKEELDANPNDNDLKYKVEQLKYALEGLIEEVDAEGEPSKFGPLMGEAINGLRKYGIKVRVRGEAVESVDSMEETLNFMMEEGNTYEAWQMSRASMSTKDTATTKVKKVLSSFQDYVENDKGELVANEDDLGFPTRMDFDAVFNGLKYSLTEHYSVPAMIATLNEQAKFKPYYREIVARLEGDLEFRSSFFHAMATQKINYIRLLDNSQTEEGDTVNTEYVIIDANRRTPERVLINNWNVSFTANLVDAKGNVKTDEVKKIRTKVTTIINNIAAQRPDELSYDRSVNLSKALGKFGMDLTSKELRTAYTNSTDFIALFQGKGLIDTALSLAEKGKNPYIVGKEGEIQAITPFIDIAVESRPALYESSMMNVENKMVFSNIAPNYASKLVTQLKEGDDIIKFLQQDKFYKKSLWLQELKDKENKKLFERHVLDGVHDGVGEKGTKYTNMSPLQRLLTDINLFYNKGNDDWGYYSIPILADAPQLNFISFKKYSSEKVIDALTNVVRQEVERNTWLAENESGVKNYSPGFYYLTNMNMFDVNNPAAVREGIEQYLDAEFNKLVKSLQDLGMLSVIGENYLAAKGLPSKINLKDMLQDYVYNSTLANIQMLQIFSGDSAFYKNEEDIVKRNKQISNPGNILDVDSMRGPLYRTLYVEDETFTSHFIKDLEKALEGNPKKEEILAQYTKTEDHEGVVQTDAQAYISLDRYRDIMKGAGLWTAKHEKAYPALRDGNATSQQLALVLQPLKPFVFTKKLYKGKIIPIQNKNSEFLLLPQMAKGKPQLEKMLEVFESGIDSIQFNSAVKVGEYNTVTADQMNKAKDLSELAKTNGIELLNEDYRIQLGVPEHHIDSSILIGTQIRKLIIANLVDDMQREKDGIAPHKYVVNGKEFTSKELFDLYQDLNSENLKENFTELNSLFQPENRAKLRALLVEEVKSRDLGQKYIDALEIDAKGEFKFPLYFPLSAKRNESMLNSLFKNRITKQKITGGSFVQVSDFGITKSAEKSDRLKVVIKDGGVLEMEAMLPWWSKKFFPTTETGEVDITKIPENLRELIGFRIPTEEKYSMVNIKVVGFTPKEAGGVAILPSDITRIAGSDFDIDKLFVMMPSFKVTDIELKRSQEDIEKEYVNFVTTPNYSPKAEEDIVRADIEGFNPKRARQEFAKAKGIRWSAKKEEWVGDKTIEKIESGMESREARNNYILDIMKSILKDPAHTEEVMTPGGFDRLKDIKNAINKVKGKTSVKLSMISPADKVELFNRNIPTIPLRGVFVNHNNNHAIIQWTDVTFTRSIKFNGDKRGNLNTKKAVDNTSISRTLADFVAASVDNVKDPVLSDLNINLFTADVAASILRVGYSLETTMLFMNQPIIEELTKRYINSGAKPWQLHGIASGLVVELLEKGAEEKEGMHNFNLNDSSMRNAIKAGLADANASHQLIALSKFLKYHEMSESLSELVNALRGDGKPAGPTLAANEVFLNRRSKVLMDKNLANVGEVLVGDKYKMIRDFTNYGIVEANNLISEHFPWYNNTFRYVKGQIAKNKGQDLTEKEIEFINYTLLSYIGSKYDFFNIPKAEMSDLINNFPAELQKEIKGDPLLENNIFTGNLIVEPSSKAKDAINVISFNNASKLSDIQKEQIDEVFSWMLEKEEYRGLAEKLVKYSFVKSGFVFGPNTFNHLVPISFYNNLRNEAGQGLNDFLKDTINPAGRTMEEYKTSAMAAFEAMAQSEVKEEVDIANRVLALGEEEAVQAINLLPADIYQEYMDVTKELDDFFVFFYRNFYDTYNFTPKVERGVNVKSEAITYDDTRTNPISLTVNPADFDSNNLYRKDKDGGYKYKPVIKLESKGEDFLFYNAGVSPEGVAVYYRLLRGGKKNQFIEFSDARDRSSVLPENAVKFVIGGENIDWGSGSISSLKKLMIDHNIDHTLYLPSVEDIDVLPEAPLDAQAEAEEARAAEEAQLKADEFENTNEGKILDYISRTQFNTESIKQELGSNIKIGTKGDVNPKWTSKTSKDTIASVAEDIVNNEVVPTDNDNDVRSIIIDIIKYGSPAKFRESKIGTSKPGEQLNLFGASALGQLGASEMANLQAYEQQKEIEKKRADEEDNKCDINPLG